jgi:hypothetical protein
MTARGPKPVKAQNDDMFSALGDSRHVTAQVCRPAMLRLTDVHAWFDAQFTRSYSLTTALAPFTLRVWLTICLWAALFV